MLLVGALLATVASPMPGLAVTIPSATSTVLTDLEAWVSPAFSFDPSSSYFVRDGTSLVLYTGGPPIHVDLLVADCDVTIEVEELHEEIDCGGKKFREVINQPVITAHPSPNIGKRIFRAEWAAAYGEVHYDGNPNTDVIYTWYAKNTITGLRPFGTEQFPRDVPSVLDAPPREWEDACGQEYVLYGTISTPQDGYTNTTSRSHKALCI